jgi:hypothetical protein
MQMVVGLMHVLILLFYCEQSVNNTKIYTDLL